MGDLERKAMNDFLTSLQLKGDIFMKQLIIERKRVGDLDQAIQASNQQIDEYRERTKQSAIGVLNLHRFTKNPAHQRADGWNPTKAADALQRKQNRILEERLNKLKIRNAETDNYNTALKHQINDLRKSRMVINATHAKYEKWMRDLRNKILDTLKDATTANEKREKAVENRNNMISKNTAERKEFEEYYLKTGEFIDDQNKLFEESIAKAAQQLEESLKNAMKSDSFDNDGSQSTNKKVVELKMKESESPQAILKRQELFRKIEYWRTRKTGEFVDEQNKLFEDPMVQGAEQLEDSLKSAMISSSTDDDGNLSISTSNKKAEELKIKKLQNAQFRLKKDELGQKVEDWKTKMQGLLDSTDYQNEEELMEAFAKKETETFSLFNYIQSINQELENVETNLARLKEEMEADKRKQESDDADRKKNLDEKKLKLAITSEANQKASHGQRVASECVERVAKTVQSLFFKIQLHQSNQGADGSGTNKLNKADGKRSGDGADGKGGSKSESKRQIAHNTEMTLTGQNVNENNIIDYLRVIEKRLIEILNEYTKKVIVDEAKEDAEVKAVGEKDKENHVKDYIKKKTAGPNDAKTDGSIGDNYQRAIKEVEQLSNPVPQTPQNSAIANVQELSPREEGYKEELEEYEAEDYTQNGFDLMKGKDIDEELKTLSLNEMLNIGIDRDDNIATVLNDVDQFQKSLWNQKLPPIGNAPGAK